MNSYIKIDNILSPDICKIFERYALYDRYNDPGSYIFPLIKELGNE